MPNNKPTVHQPIFLADEGPEYAKYLTTDGSNPDARPAKPSEITPHAPAEMLDQEEEGDNYHALVGAYSGLLGVLCKLGLTDKQLLKTMRLLVDAGGLRGLARASR